MYQNKVSLQSYNTKSILRNILVSMVHTSMYWYILSSYPHHIQVDQHVLYLVKEAQQWCLGTVPPYTHPTLPESLTLVQSQTNVCSHIFRNALVIPVHTIMYQCCSSTYSHRSHSHFISNQAPSCLRPSLVSFQRDVVISRTSDTSVFASYSAPQNPVKQGSERYNQVWLPGMYMYILSSRVSKYKFTHVFTCYKQVHLGIYWYIPVYSMNILVHT